MRSGLKAATSRCRARSLPSSQNTSLLMTKKNVVEQWQRPRDTAAGIEQLGFGRDLDARVVPPRKLRDDHRRLVMHIYDDPFNPNECQPVDRVIEQGPAVYLDQRFRNGSSDRPQPGTKPGGERHGCPRRDDSAGICRTERGRWRSIQPAARGEGQVGGAALQQPPNPREMDEVAWFAVALPQSREDAEDLAVALSREDGRRSRKSARSSAGKAAR